VKYDVVELPLPLRCEMRCVAVTLRLAHAVILRGNCDPVRGQRGHTNYVAAWSHGLVMLHRDSLVAGGSLCCHKLVLRNHIL